MERDLEKYLKEAEMIKAEEFVYILKVRLHLSRIWERDMADEMVNTLRPFQDYLIRSVWEAQDMARSNIAWNRPPIMRRLASWFKTINLGGGGSR